MWLRRLIVAAASVAFLPGPLRSQSEPAAHAQPPSSAEDPFQWRNVALGRALIAAGAIAEPYRRAQTLASIARTQTLIAEAAADQTIHQALSAAQQVAEPAFRGWALYEIVLAQIAADDLYGARETASRIETKRQRSAALGAIAGVQLRAGDLRAVQATVSEIRERSVQGEILRQIVVAQSARDDLAAARETLTHIDEAFYHALAAGDLAAAEVRHGRVERANALAARTGRADRGKVYARIALARADAGDMRGAAESLQKIGNELDRAVVQGRIAAAYAVAGDARGAGQLFTSALASVSGHRNQPERRAMALAQLARLQAASGDPAAAGKVLRRALQDAERIQPGEQREEILDYIARGQARAADPTAALETALRMRDRVARARCSYATS